MPGYIVAPATAFTGDALTDFTNAVYSPDGTFSGVTNGVEYRSIRVSDGSSTIIPTETPVVTPVLSHTMVLGETPTMPAGLTVGDQIILVGVADGAAPPVLPAGWTNRTILGAGAAGNLRQVAFRNLSKVWADGDTLPVFTNAQFVVALRVNPAWQSFRDPISLAAASFGLGTGNSPPGVAISTAALQNNLAIGSYHLILTAARSVSGQALIDLAPQGFTQIANTGAQEMPTRRNLWIKGPTTIVGGAGAIPLPIPFDGSNGGGTLAIGLEPV